MTLFVLDNSVTMRWIFEARAHAYADAVLDDLSRPEGTAVVPILWRYEVSSVLARAELRGQVAAKVVSEFLSLLDSFKIEVDDESSRRILTDVHRLAVAYRLTSYDAAYLELAQRRNLPLATLDAELVAACASAGVALV